MQCLFWEPAIGRGAPSELIHTRPRRPLFMLAAAWGLGALALDAAAMACWILRPDLEAIILVLSIAGGIAWGATAWYSVKLIRGPNDRLAFFRDRLVVLQGRTEMRALWDAIETVSLADQRPWGSASWPDITLTSRLTIRLRNERAVVFEPADFGMNPVACRDRIIELRDQRRLRRALPEFDSALDLRLYGNASKETLRPRQR